MKEEQELLQEKKPGKIKMKLTFSILILAVLFVVELYLMMNFSESYLFLGIVGLAILCFVYLITDLFFKLQNENEERRGKEYESLYKAQKVSYVHMKQCFLDLEKLLDEIKANTEVPADELIEAQKAVGKITINRNKENALAIINSNDKLLDQIHDLEEKMTEIISKIQEPNNDEQIIAKQQEIIESMEHTQISFKDEISRLTENMEVQINEIRDAVMQAAQAKENVMAREAMKEKEPVMPEAAVIPEAVTIPQEPMVAEKPVEPEEGTIPEEKPVVLEEPIIPEENEIPEEPVIAEKPVIPEEPIIAEEPVITKQPVIPEEPMIAKEPVISEEPMIAEEPVIVPEPIMAKEPMIAEEPAKAPESIMIKEPVIPEERILAEEPVIPEKPVVTEEAVIPKKAKSPESLTSGQNMTSDEIAEMLSKLNGSEVISEPVAEDKPKKPNLSDPGHVMTPEEIAALLGNM